MRQSIYRSYGQLIRLHVKPLLGRIRLTKLTPLHVQRLMTGRVAAGLSPSTAVKTRAVLRRALGHAVKWDQVKRHVAALAEPPKVEREPVEPPTLEEARTVRHHIDGDRREAGGKGRKRHVAHENLLSGSARARAGAIALRVRAGVS